MPSVPDITLGKGQMLVTDNQSVLGITTISGNLVFGTIQAIYSTSDNLAVNDNIMFDATKALQFIYGSTIYFLVTEDSVSGQEIPPL